MTRIEVLTRFFSNKSVFLASALMVSIISACSTAPLLPYSEDSTPLVLVPISLANVKDQRGRFREIFCTILEERKAMLPDYRPCDDALTRVGVESHNTGKKVQLGPSQKKLVAVVVPGVGWSCFADWLKLTYSVRDHVRQFGYDQVTLSVDALSGTANNARQIRDALMNMSSTTEYPNLVLIGYSKGASDILEAVVAYPEIHHRIAAVISTGGSVGGSPLANDAQQSDLEILKHWPEAKCSASDGRAVESLRPSVRKAWLAQHPLPNDIPYYSLVTYPKPERISAILESSYEKLSHIDARNDSQVLFYDQIIPGSTLIGYLNADHWALAVPIARTHSILGSTFVDQNQFPREALAEALLRFIEEDIEVTRE